MQEAEAGFSGLSEAIDTTSAPDRMMMRMVGAFAEYKRAIAYEPSKGKKTAADAARLFSGQPVTTEF
jgi:DNA invertase Pin-like site-specific DNA recombinase